MSTWIFDRNTVKTILALTAIAGLTACGSSRFGSNAPRVAKVQKSTIEVAGTSIDIAGPPGFCMDQSASQVEYDTAFVLLGNCAVVSPKAGGGQPKVKALLTASVSGAGDSFSGEPETFAAMDRFFRSETGRTALSRSSDPGTVQILDSFENDGAFFIRASDASPGIVPDASPDYWRSYFAVNNLLVSVSVIGFTTSPLSPSVGLDTVRDFTKAMQGQPLGTSVQPAAVLPTVTPARVEPKPGPTLRRVGILRRLLG